jgi:signal transduction histidine kinase
MEARPTAVAEVVARAVALAEGELMARTVRLRHEHEASLPLIHADADLVCQVLVGLLANAAQATQPGGEVTLRAAPAGDGIELMVSDDGPGIAPDLRERVFEPFFTTRTDGTGLGLAVARQIVEAHGGRISAGNGPAGGACFTVHLPVKAAA